MFAKRCLTALIAAATLSAAGHVQAASLFNDTFTINYDVAVFKEVGFRHFDGSFSFDGQALTGTGIEVLKFNEGLINASLDFKGTVYTPTTNDSAKAKFVDGELVGLSFKFHTNQHTFRVKFGEFIQNFSDVVGIVTYDDAAYVQALAATQGGSPTVGGDPLSVPTPAAGAAGLAMLAAMAFRRRRPDAL